MSDKCPKIGVPSREVMGTLQWNDSRHVIGHGHEMMVLGVDVCGSG